MIPDPYPPNPYPPNPYPAPDFTYPFGRHNSTVPSPGFGRQSTGVDSARTPKKHYTHRTHSSTHDIRDKKHPQVVHSRTEPSLGNRTSISSGSSEGHTEPNMNFDDDGDSLYETVQRAPPPAYPNASALRTEVSQDAVSTQSTLSVRADDPAVSTQEPQIEVSQDGMRSQDIHPVCEIHNRNGNEPSPSDRAPVSSTLPGPIIQTSKGYPVILNHDGEDLNEVLHRAFPKDSATGYTGNDPLCPKHDAPPPAHPSPRALHERHIKAVGTQNARSVRADGPVVSTSQDATGSPDIHSVGGNIPVVSDPAPHAPIESSKPHHGEENIPAKTEGQKPSNSAHISSQISDIVRSKSAKFKELNVFHKLTVLGPVGVQTFLQMLHDSPELCEVTVKLDYDLPTDRPFLGPSDEPLLCPSLKKLCITTLIDPQIFFKSVRVPALEILVITSDSQQPRDIKGLEKMLKTNHGSLREMKLVDVYIPNAELVACLRTTACMGLETLKIQSALPITGSRQDFVYRSPIRRETIEALAEKTDGNHLLCPRLQRLALYHCHVTADEYLKMAKARIQSPDFSRLRLEYDFVDKKALKEVERELVKLSASSTFPDKRCRLTFGKIPQYLWPLKKYENRS
ncbi:hypothetical protein H0H92_008807, partial [Tricholoma furcatifolium]